MLMRRTPADAGGGTTTNAVMVTEETSGLGGKSHKPPYMYHRKPQCAVSCCWVSKRMSGVVKEESDGVEGG